ncbi:hypothetical protein [Spirosoma areae]
MLIIGCLGLPQQAQAQVGIDPAETAEQTHRLGALLEVYSYSQLMYDRLGIGGYFGAITYKALPFATLGLGYDYSIYNHSLLLDIRQEVSRMRLRPVLIAGLGYALAGNQQTITSSFGLQKDVTPQRGLVYRIGGGLRAYYFRRLPIAINAGLFYKSEPGYDVTETKSGSIVVNAYQNVGSFCLSLGLTY